VKLWRICRAPFQDLDGEGAKLHGGRWNSEGIPVVYLSTTLALAAMEYLVHVDVRTAPSDLIAIELDAPDDLSREEVDPKTLPEDWNVVSDHPRCVDLGDEWARRGEAALLFVPSAVIPNSWNVLLNPLHADSARVTHTIEPFVFDRRLLE
jgi:RES domain-containing protein